MNVVILTGRLTRDLELKFGQSGKGYSKFSLAVDNPFKKDEADFINCSAFGKTAELIAEWCRKGSKIAIVGRLAMNKFEKDGEKRTSYEVIVDTVEFPPKTDGTTSTNSKSEPKEEPRRVRGEDNKQDFDNDEFPF